MELPREGPCTKFMELFFKLAHESVNSYQHLVLTISNLRKMTSKLWATWPMYVLKVYFNVCISHESVDEPSCGQPVHEVELPRNGTYCATEGVNLKHFGSVTILSCWRQGQCKPVLFQDADFAGVLTGSNSTSVGMLCIVGDHNFVPISMGM